MHLYFKIKKMKMYSINFIHILQKMKQTFLFILMYLQQLEYLQHFAHHHPTK